MQRLIINSQYAVSNIQRDNHLHSEVGRFKKKLSDGLVLILLGHQAMIDPCGWKLQVAHCMPGLPHAMF